MFNLNPDPYRYDRSDLIDESDKDKRLRILGKNKGSCLYCGDPNPDTIDHVVPISSRLPFVNEEFNLWPCCNACNSAKSNQPWSKFFRASKHYSRDQENFIRGLLSEHVIITGDKVKNYVC